MLKRPVGALAMAGAAIDDVTAWGLLALATARRGRGSGIDVALVVVGATALFASRMIARRPPAARRASRRPTTRSGACPTLWLGDHLRRACCSPPTWRGEIGIAPDLRRLRDRADHAAARRAHATTCAAASRTSSSSCCCRSSSSSPACGREINALNRWELWADHPRPDRGRDRRQVGRRDAAAPRYGGFGWRESNAIGALMNTRGLTELIVLNIGLDLGLISPQLFTMLVVMALVTTFMAGPALQAASIRTGGSPSRRRRSCGRRARAAPERDAGGARTRSSSRRRIRRTSTRCSRSASALAGVAAAARARPRPPARAAALRDRASPRDDRAARGRRPTSCGAGARRWPSAASTRGRSRSRRPTPGDDLVRLAADEPSTSCSLDGRRPLLGDGRPEGRGRQGARGRAVRRRRARRARGRRAADRRRPSGRRARSAAPSTTGRRSSSASWIASARAGAAAAARRGVRSRDRRARREPAARERVARRAAADRASWPSRCSSSPGPDVHPRGAKAPGCSSSGLSERWREEGLGALRARARQVGARVRRCSSGAASGPACSRAGSDVDALPLVDMRCSPAGRVLESPSGRTCLASALVPLSQPRDSSDRDRRRRLRLADRLLDRRLPRLPARAGHDLRPERQRRSARTSSSRYNLGQTVLRSESESHFLPADWPTFAQLDAWARREPVLPAPLDAGASTTPACRTSSPRPQSCSSGSGWNDNRYPTRVGWLQREGEGTDDRTSCSTTRRRTSSAARGT